MPLTEQDKRAKEYLELRDQSRDWLKQNYAAQWTRVYASYLCERIENEETGNVGDGIYDAYNRPLSSSNKKQATSLAMPDTFALVNRQVARLTAQPPNLKCRADDQMRAENVSRKLMRDWDKGGVQRIQKKHARQAALYGWSVRPWFWENTEFTRKKRVDPLDPASAEVLRGQYGELQSVDPAMDPEGWTNAIADVTVKYGRGGLVSVDYPYRGYVGPKTEFLYIGDCFPEPKFESIQKSNWFGVQRRRNVDWIKSVVQRYPEFKAGFAALVEAHPKGSDPNGLGGDREGNELRQQMLAAINQSDPKQTAPKEFGTRTWTITEFHFPGREPKLAFVGENGIWIGEIEYPYELEGRIAFTELVLIDNLLGGIGDSHARVIRGLQALHDRQMNQRSDLIHNILRPFVYTTDKRFYDNPDMLKRSAGFRLIYTPDGPQSVGIVGEQAAMASAASSLAGDADIERQIQKATGESNMSMAAGVDPQQARTATGARIMAYNADILTKDQVEMYNLALREDAYMMYLLNRSEMDEQVEFDARPYFREYQGAQDAPAPAKMTVDPKDFQFDDEVDVEVGSTLADDDEAKVQRAQALATMFRGNPGVNQATLDKRLLIALGEGGNLNEWAPPPPQPPPPPEPPRVNVSVAVKYAELPDIVKVKLAERMANGEVPVTQMAMEGDPVAMPNPPEEPEPSDGGMESGNPEGAKSLEAGMGNRNR